MRARVKGFTILEAWAVCGRFLVSSCVITVLERVYCSLSRVRGSYPDFRIPPNNSQHKMIDRYSNNIVITSQDRLQDMDKWEDYPIKVLDMAPLIMVTLPTVCSCFSTCGCFLRVERSSFDDLPPLSLSSLWMASRCEWLPPLWMAVPPQT
jgi:hypothetical protein